MFRLWLEDGISEGDIPHYLWELALVQLLVAGVTASWFWVDIYFDPASIEAQVILWFSRLNAAAIFVVPVIVSFLLLAAGVRRSWKIALVAVAECMLWLAHWEAFLPQWT